MLIYKTDAGQFVMSHGSYDLNLGSEILILGGDIMSRSWPNIGDSYGIRLGIFACLPFFWRAKLDRRPFFAHLMLQVGIKALRNGYLVGSKECYLLSSFFTKVTKPPEEV